MRRFVNLWLALAIMLALGNFVYAQESFFKGKTIRIGVPFAAGAVTISILGSSAEDSQIIPRPR